MDNHTVVEVTAVGCFVYHDGNYDSNDVVYYTVPSSSAFASYSGYATPQKV